MAPTTVLGRQLYHEAFRPGMESAPELAAVGLGTAGRPRGVPGGHRVSSVAMSSQGPTHEAVRRLAQYRPFDQGGTGLIAVLRDLVLAAAAINGGSFANLGECRD